MERFGWRLSLFYGLQGLQTGLPVTELGISTWGHMFVVLFCLTTYV